MITTYWPLPSGSSSFSSSAGVGSGTGAGVGSGVTSSSSSVNTKIDYSNYSGTTSTKTLIRQSDIHAPCIDSVCLKHLMTQNPEWNIYFSLMSFSFLHFFFGGGKCNKNICTQYQTLYDLKLVMIYNVYFFIQAKLGLIISRYISTTFSKWSIFKLQNLHDLESWQKLWIYFDAKIPHSSKKSGKIMYCSPRVEITQKLQGPFGPLVLKKIGALNFFQGQIWFF